MQVKQKESDEGDYWYTVDRGGSTMLTSETYPNRDNALRAARGYIDAIDPVPVTFTYWAGPRPPFASMVAAFESGRRQVEEQIR